MYSGKIAVPPGGGGIRKMIFINAKILVKNSDFKGIIII
jgi:hypothetical protein